MYSIFLGTLSLLLNTLRTIIIISLNDANMTLHRKKKDVRHDNNILIYRIQLFVNAYRFYVLKLLYRNKFAKAPVIVPQHLLPTMNIFFSVPSLYK